MQIAVIRSQQSLFSIQLFKILPSLIAAPTGKEENERIISVVMKRHWSEKTREVVFEAKKDSSIKSTSLGENANVTNNKNYQCPQSSQDADWPSTVSVTDSVDDDVPYLDHLMAVLYPMSAKLAKIELKNGEIIKWAGSPSTLVMPFS